MSDRSKKDKEKRVLKDSKSIRGLERKEHFDNNGTLSSWRGIHKIQTNKGSRRVQTRANKTRRAIEFSSEE